MRGPGGGAPGVNAAAKGPRGVLNPGGDSSRGLLAAACQQPATRRPTSDQLRDQVIKEAFDVRCLSLGHVLGYALCAV
jgi:hypothetical protein